VLIDPLAGHDAKRARLEDHSISPSAVWVKNRLIKAGLQTTEHQKVVRLWPPSQASLLQALQDAMAWKPKSHTTPVFQFEFSSKTATHNFGILMKHNFDLDKILQSNPHSPLHPGSEFRPVPILKPIFQDHPLWTWARETLIHGAHYFLLPLEDDLRKQDLATAITFGNHKSAVKHGPETMATLKKEMTKGWQLPLPMDKLLDIPHLLLTPVGMAEQLKLQASGERLPECRLTHNMSMVFEPSSTSLNARVDSTKLSKCIYGFALSQFINAIVKLHRRHPGAPIFLSKFDLKSAYLHVHLRDKAALQSCVATTGLAPEHETVFTLLGIHMTFGGRPNPNIFCEVSDLIVDLAIVLSQCPNWSPETMPSSYAHVLKAPVSLPDNTPFAQAHPSLGAPPVPEVGTADGFIDDLFLANVITAEKNQHADRLAQAILLLIEVLGRPHSDHETLLCDVLLSLEKQKLNECPTRYSSSLVGCWIPDGYRSVYHLTNTLCGPMTSKQSSPLQRGHTVVSMASKCSPWKAISSM
jgi:hypothetical protein